ncbi:SGNH/GDSL hydrolase family protein [Longimicrobium terrae]|uniref:SGNH hydrolase-type esterase domain-containing protein n=1 Tax=Longimicrobium terrae TaxID=1639882 RepID=A0A841H5H3_9BACT|nr:SGNH/GDSL hydrolase family protein [Longimicrobium terrae]MBB4639235.1 hypothetical protein [Longimicrobium terrae]MBB6073475.1 hypothetical protein [Longimicrobium terrae]NNC32275.1 SGNH/GDSL hydrolase family protein [Longimicrobium terrae]
MPANTIPSHHSWPILLVLAAVPLGGCGDSSTGPAPIASLAPADTVRVTTFGDSNTDMAWSFAEPHVLARSYVSDAPPRPSAAAGNHGEQLAGRMELRWRALQPMPIRVVNHGITGTTTGGGDHGGPDRNGNGSPNARAMVNGITRFQAEVLGMGAPWSGGEPFGTAFPQGGIVRVNAYVPDSTDFAYVSLGTNDFGSGIAPARTIQNLEWMMDQWMAAGHAADHLVLTTLAPRPGLEQGDAIAEVNAGIREMAARTGAGLIDLGAFATADDGLSWRAPWMHIGDGVHYTTPVRDWITEQMVSYMASRIPSRNGAAPHP